MASRIRFVEPEKMEIFTRKELRGLIAQSKMIYGDTARPEIMESDSGLVYKAFYPRGRFTKSRIYPKGIRFADNGRKLKQLGIDAPFPERLIHCPDGKMHLVAYKKLPGTDLRHLTGNPLTQALEQLSKYLGELHNLGIVFRAIHLGNILKTSNSAMALLDIADLSISPRPISLWHRAKNLIHLLKKTDDHEALVEFGMRKFLTRYCHHAGLSDTKQKLLSKALEMRLGNVFHEA